MNIEILADEGIIIKVNGLNRLNTELAAKFYKDLRIDRIDFIELGTTLKDDGFEFCVPAQDQELSLTIDMLQAINKSINRFKNLTVDAEDLINRAKN